MIAGTGIDLVDVAELERLLAAFPDRTWTRIFTARGRRDAARFADRPRARAEFLATRFGAKEAVFKAVAHLLPEKFFDLRIVETVNDPDGAPRIGISSQLQDVLDRAGVGGVFVSMSTQSGLVVVTAIAERAEAGEE